MDENDRERAAAIERLKSRRGFVPHVVAYLAVNAALIAIWAMSDSSYFWPIWVLVGWGVGLVMHGYTAFVQKPITEDDVRREIQRGRSVID